MHIKMIKALAFLALALPLASCNGGTGNNSNSNTGGGNEPTYVMPEKFENIELTVWDSISGLDGTAYSAMIDQFNTEYIGQIYVRRVGNPTDTSYYNNVEMALAMGNGPDVVETGNDIMAQWGYQGNILANCEPIFEAIGKPIDESDFDANILESATWSDELISVPMGMHGTVIFINDTLWNQYFPNTTMPTTWTRDLVKQYASQIYELSDGKVYGLPMSSQFPGNTYGQFDAFYQNGGHFTTTPDNYDVGFNSEEGIKGIQAFTDIIFNRNNEWGGASNLLGNDADLNYFNSQQALFCVDGTWCLPNINTAVETQHFEWHAAPVSGLYALDADAEYANSMLVQSHNLGITQQCAADNDKACAAAVFIDWMTRNCLDYCEAGHIAARKSVRESAEYQALPHHDEFGDSANYVLNESNPAVLFMQGEYSAAMSEVMNAGTNDEATVQGTLNVHEQEAQEKIEAWLASY